MRPFGRLERIFLFFLLMLAISTSAAFVGLYNGHRQAEESRRQLREMREEIQKTQEYLQKQVEFLEKVDSFIEKTEGFLQKLKIEPDTTVTYYAPFDNVSGMCNDGDPNVTATGTKPGPGTMAVNPKVIPYGSRMWILYEDGTIERGRALDTGGAILASRSRVDVYRDTHRQAMRDGVKGATVIWQSTAKPCTKR